VCVCVFLHYRQSICVSVRFFCINFSLGGFTVVASLVVGTGAVDCLERLVSEITDLLYVKWDIQAHSDYECNVVTCHLNVQ